MILKQGWGVQLLVTAAVAAATASMAAEPGFPQSAGATFELFSAAEAAAWNSAQPKQPGDFTTRDLREENGAPTCRSLPNNDADNPRIRILAPILGKTLTAPLDIDLQFVPTGSAPIRPDTFRVCYVGSITMDITKRITDRVSVSENRLHVAGAQLPHGHHRLLLLIADERGRLGRSEAVFDID
jgi:hypothetical protein